LDTTLSDERAFELLEDFHLADKREPL
jgi:hypothetical protein